MKILCRKCPLHKNRRTIVSDRGTLAGPVDILLIGEGPGESEDMMGSAFVGRSGKLLQHAMKESGLDTFTFRITNLVCCRPCDSLNDKNREPSKDEMIACNPRLMSTYFYCKPSIVIKLGKVAKENTPDIQGINLDHPSFVLRNGGRGTPYYFRFVEKMREVVDALRSS